MTKLKNLIAVTLIISAGCITSSSGAPASPVIVAGPQPTASAAPTATEAPHGAAPTTIPPLPTPEHTPSPEPPGTRATPLPTAVVTVSPDDSPTPVAPAPAPTPDGSPPTATPTHAPTPTAAPVSSTPKPAPAQASATPVPPPPGSFQTAEEAIARAAEVGCSGWRGETVDGAFGYFPCGDRETYEALIAGGPFNLMGEPCTLESDPDVRFTAPVTDIDLITSIIPSGSPAGGVIKPHSYIHGPRSGDRNASIPVYAPVDSWLVNIAYYDENVVGEYLLTFGASCEVWYRLDHIVTPIQAIRDLGPEVPASSTGGGVRLTEPLFFNAGDLIAHTPGAGNGSGPWDFGAYNTTVVNTFANQARYASATNTGQAINAVCPYDLYDEPLRSRFRAFFGGNSGAGYPDAACPGGRDVPGTLAGAWFGSESGTTGDGFAIALLPDGLVAMTGAGIDVRVEPGAPTWADPASVTASHCFDGGQWGTAYMELIAPDRLAVADPGAVCPTSLPTDHTVYYR